MRKRIAWLLLLTLLFAVPQGGAEGGTEKADTPEEAVTFTAFLTDLLTMETLPEKVEADLDALQDPLADAVAAEWRKVWLDPGEPLLLDGTDDPASLPVRGKHAFVVLGYQLEDGKMTEELEGRCAAAAAAARAFPDSLLVCSGGATGRNNPEKHTEAGLMKRYLTQQKGIDPERIFIDERAMSTSENAVNTFEILKEQGVETITLVTSSYHQHRAHMLYFTLAELIREAEGRETEIIGNYSYDAGDTEWKAENEKMSSVFQMDEIVRRIRGK